MDLLKSALGGGKQNDLLSIVMNLIGGQKGGLNGLVSQFASNGLGDIVESWIGTGANKAISPEQLQNALGSDQIKTIASKLGIDQNSVLSQLTNLLPQAVDKLTPEGKVPEGDILSQGMNLLGGLFGSK
ncbi:MAG: DUF937 domain-containing protein [Ignavibacteriales bacterium]|jgi:uncharacterized protein YidB (DUF937 family)|nr:DUF937 domain-containing protein [Ignavibacteriales bacterium]MBK7978658.1 DUF937 domain-containing protein [Ignavibacteriota bacterium]